MVLVSIFIFVDQTIPSQFNTINLNLLIPNTCGTPQNLPDPLSYYYAVMATGRGDHFCHLLACPREIRDQIYAEILLEFPTPSLEDLLDCAMLDEPGTTSERYLHDFALECLERTHKIETNILLTNRQILAEAKQILLRRGRLVKVIASNVDLPQWLCSSQLCVIDAKYSTLCIMTHHCK